MRLGLIVDLSDETPSHRLHFASCHILHVVTFEHFFDGGSRSRVETARPFHL